MHSLKFILCLIFMIVSFLGFIFGSYYFWSGFLFILVLGFIGDSI